jgi:nitrite reductase/ring-hydroxylating ferredoxin subunit
VEEFRAVMDEGELRGSEMHAVEIDDGDAVLQSRSETGEVCAIANTCTHRGGPLAEGERMGDTVICPWHGSEFDLCSGAVKRGPATEPQQRFEVRGREGKIEIRPL